MKLFSYGNFVSWDHCIEANKICTLRNCPDTLNCCSTNCMGISTLEGGVLMGSIAVIILFLAMVYKFCVYDIKSMKGGVKQNGEKLSTGETGRRKQ